MYVNVYQVEIPKQFVNMYNGGKLLYIVVSKDLIVSYTVSVQKL